MSDASGLAEWLDAQVDEDERIACAAAGRIGELLGWLEVGIPEEAHIALWDTDRALAEVEFKRQILAIHRRRADVPASVFDGCCDGCGYGGICEDPNVEDINDCPELRAMAAVYAGRPGCREEWRS